MRLPSSLLQDFNSYFAVPVIYRREQSLLISSFLKKVESAHSRECLVLLSANV